jgi:glycosyltransferase involved in cell wall biosynthesis
MKVFVIPSFYPTEDSPNHGIFFKEQAEILYKLGCDIYIIYPELRSIKEITFKKIAKFHFQNSFNIENGLKVYRNHRWNVIPTGNHIRLGYRIWINAVKDMVESLVSQGIKPDVIHAHGMVCAGVAAYEINKMFGIPYIVTEHSSGFKDSVVKNAKDINILKDVLKNASRILAVSPALKKSISKFVEIDNHLSIEIIPNFIDTSFFALKEDINKDKFVFFTASNLTENKNVNRLIEAFKIVFASNTNIELRIGGNGKTKKILEDFVRLSDLSKNVIFLGELSREDIRNEMLRANCFVLSSDYETFGVVLIEAMAVGTPVISTKCGGPEFIINDTVGLLSEKNAEKLSENMNKIIINKNDYNSVKIRNYVLETFSDIIIGNKYLNIYESLK